MRTMRALAFILVPAISLAGILFCPNLSLAASAAASQDALHEVLPGDDLRLIAGYYYGDARQWEHIWKANRAQIKNPNRIEQGSLLRIPDATSPTETYDEFLARVRGPRAPVVTAPAPASGIPAGDLLPPPSGPVTLRFKPVKGALQTTRVTITDTNEAEIAGRQQRQEKSLRARLRLLVEDAQSDGLIHLAVSLSDAEIQGEHFPFAKYGLPAPGETLQLTVDSLGKVMQVKGKERTAPGNDNYYSPGFLRVFREAPVAVGGGWPLEGSFRLPSGDRGTMKGRCTLVRRERFRNEEAFRIECQAEASTSPNAQMSFSTNGGATYTVRARDGLLLFSEGGMRGSSNWPAQQLKGTMEDHAVFDMESSGAPEPAVTPARPATPAPQKAPVAPAPPPPAPAKVPAPAAAPAAPAPAKQAGQPPAAKAPAPPAKGPTKAAPPPPKEWYEELLSPEFFTSIEFLAGAGVLILALLGLVIWRRRSAAVSAE